MASSGSAERLEKENEKRSDRRVSDVLLALLEGASASADPTVMMLLAWCHTGGR